MAVLLTGGAGFIGSACLRALIERGDDVVVLDSFESLVYPEAPKRRNLAWARAAGPFALVEGDLRDRPRLDRIFREHSIDCVVHLAAVAGVRTSILHPATYYDINLTGSVQLLEAARAAGTSRPRLVLASSSSVYGNASTGPFHESQRTDAPVSPYAASKKALECAAAAFHALNGGDVSLLRFFTVYGPRQRPDMAIYRFMGAIAQGTPVTMFGDGSTGRDYTFVDDIVRGVLAAVDRSRGFQIYNLGGDRVVLLRDLIATIGRVLGVEPKIEAAPMQPGDVELTMADLSRSRAELGYSPVTSLEDGLFRMWSWWQDAGPRG